LRIEFGFLLYQPLWNPPDRLNHTAHFPGNAMSIKLYVGNLDYQISNDGLEKLFAQAGKIESARVITTIAGNPRGFGFVEMSSREEGAAAIAQFNGREINGRRLIVNEEEPPMTRAAGMSFGGNGRRKEKSYAASSAIS
jgi:RNA recognition motif-containing protein